MIFPEGSARAPASIALFQSAGVKILLKNAPGALVVPVYIHDTWKLNRFGTFPMSAGESVGWTVLDPIEPAGLKADDVAALAERRIRDAHAVAKES